MSRPAGVRELVFAAGGGGIVEKATGNCGGEGVGGIVGLWLFLEAEMDFYHFLNLGFRSGAVAGKGLFNLVRGVFENRKIFLGGDEENDAAGLGDGNAGSNIFREKEAFDSDEVGLRLVENDEEGLVKLL